MQFGLLSAGDDVDVIAAAQAVIDDVEQAIGIGRIVNAGDFAAALQSVVDEAGGLVAETVVIVAPAVASDENIERCERAAPREIDALLEPLGVLRDHGVNYLRERFVGRPNAVAAGEEIAFKPAFAEMFAEDFHDTAVGSEMIVNGNCLLHGAAIGGVEDGVEAVGIGFIRAEEAEIYGILFDDVAEIFAEFARGFRDYFAGTGDFEGVACEIREVEGFQDAATVDVRAGAHALVAVGGEGCQLGDEAALLIE